MQAKLAKAVIETGFGRRFTSPSTVLLDRLRQRAHQLVDV